MKKRLGLLLLSSAFCCVSGAVWAQQEPRAQPGATQKVTSEYDPIPRFNQDYFVGDWKFEGATAESPIGEGGPISGTETVRQILDGRFWDIKIQGEGPDGKPFTGSGIMFFEATFAGQFFTRYEVSQGRPMLRTGTLGCDLGGTCNVHYETPPFESNGSIVQLRGRFFMPGIYNYRLTTEISVDKGEYKNLGSVWYTKDPTTSKKEGAK